MSQTGILQFTIIVTGIILIHASTSYSQVPFKKLVEIAQPVQRPEGAPNASDVIMRNLRPHPRDANDPYDTMEAMEDFHVTRLEWTYIQDFSFINQVKATGRAFGGAVNNSSLHSDFKTGTDWLERYAILDLDGNPVVAPHMRDWGERLHGCVNDSVFEEGYLAYLKEYIDAGADVMQRDDPNANYSATNWGACFCEDCMIKFRIYLEDHSTLQERESWGIYTLETFNYRDYLIARSAPVGDDFSKWDGGKLKELFVQFQKGSTIDFHQRTRQAINEYVRQFKPEGHVPMSCNNGVRRWFEIELEFDWTFGELSYSNASPEYLYSAMEKAIQYDRMQVITMPKKGNYDNLDAWELLTRQTIATTYSCGGLCMVPWDVYMPNDAPRYFGTPEQYADLYKFVRDHAEYFDEYEDAAFSMPYKNDQRYLTKLPIEFVTGEEISTFARAKPGQVDAPIIVHLVDWSDSPEPFKVSLANDLFFGNYDLNVRLLRPGYSELTPVIKTVGDRTEIDIPALTPWGLLVVTAGEFSGRPQVWITSPAPADTFSVNTDITIEVAALDSIGWITNVEFYNDTTKIGEDTTEPYSVLWEHVPAGWYTLRAKATDNDGLWSTSIVNIRVGSIYAVDKEFIGHWKLDEQSGSTAYDASPNHYNGIVYGSPGWVDGKINGAAEFDSYDAYIKVADNDDLEIDTGDFSISLWFKRYSNATPNLRLLSKGAGQDSHAGYCFFGSNTSITAAIGNGQKRIYASAAHSGIDEWTHLVLNVKRGGSLFLYINGSMSGSANITEFDGQTLNNDYPFYIGQHEAGILRWHGIIDDVRVYRRTLNDMEIDRLYQVSNTVTGILNEKEMKKSYTSSFGLRQNYPNPFNAETKIPINLHKATHVRLSIYNVMGQQVAVPFDGNLDTGNHEIVWNGRDIHGQPVSSGIYFIRMKAGNYDATNKTLLLK